MNFRSSASFGKRQEFVAIAELLRRGFDVYLTLVDDQQIDCVVRQERDGALTYLDLQIKARSKEAKHAATFAAMEVKKPRPNFFFIFYAEVINTYWVIPSLELIKLANVRKSGKSLGMFRIDLCNKTKTGWRPRPKFDAYKNAFHLLE
jgi:hypothetical protein